MDRGNYSGTQLMPPAAASKKGGSEQLLERLAYIKYVCYLSSTFVCCQGGFKRGGQPFSGVGFLLGIHDVIFFFYNRF